MKSKKLSICIPTYNRGIYLNRLLKMLFKENQENVIEIVIGDNNSTDETEIIVKKWQKKMKNIKYIKNKKNVGFDNNLNNIIKNSNGKYCWILGDDDGVVKGSIELVLKKINSNSTVYVLNGIICDTNLKPIKPRNGLKKINEDKKIILENLKDIKKYTKLIDYDISLFFAFISELIITKDEWVKYEKKSMFKETAYDHIFIILLMLNKKSSIEYLHEKYYLASSSSNEHTKIKGKHNLLDLSSYYKFINYFSSKFGNDFSKESGIDDLFLRGSSIMKFIEILNFCEITNENKNLQLYLKFFSLDKSFKYKIAKIFYNLKFSGILYAIKEIKNKWRK